jgi:hypothetical protein
MCPFLQLGDAGGEFESVITILVFSYFIPKPNYHQIDSGVVQRARKYFVRELLALEEEINRLEA